MTRRPSTGGSRSGAGWRRRGSTYHGSWVTDDLTRCYQVMECGDRSLLEEWMEAWDDLVRFEVIEVMSSADAVAAVAARR